MASDPAYSDIQGVLINGYRGYNFIRFLIFTIPSGSEAAAQKLMGALVPGTAGSPLTLTAATRWNVANPPIMKPPYRLNLGITNTGLKKIVGATNYKTVFNASYQVMNSFERGAKASAQRVGDVGPSDPSQWWMAAGGWRLPGSDPATTDLDLLFSLYAPTPEEREVWGERLVGMVGDAAQLAFAYDSDPLDPVGQEIHFGFRDGISQPRIDGFSETDPNLDDRPRVEAWRFIIDAHPHLDEIVHHPPTYHAHPLLDNGSFGAFRMLYQDSGAFDDFIHQTGPEQAELIAAKMCGRWRDGTPVEISPDHPIEQKMLGHSLRNEYELTNFDYVTTSEHQEPKPAPKGNPDLGQACPYAAHIRRSNPRDDTSVTGNVNFADDHRVLRRARPYGPPYDPAVRGSRSEERGLIGLFIGADLGNQFEFLMSQWITNGGFSTNDGSPNQSGYDPLFGPPPGSTVSDAFSYCTGDPKKATDYTTLPMPLPQLVITRGGMYVFLPSITALGWLAKGAVPPKP